MKNMDQTAKINEADIMEKDVKTMSYDDLMAAVRFLDQEREMLSAHVYEIADKRRKKFEKQEKVSRAA